MRKVRGVSYSGKDARQGLACAMHCISAFSLTTELRLDPLPLSYIVDRLQYGCRRRL